MAVVIGQALFVHFVVGLSVQALGEDRDDEDVDEEGDEEGDRRLDEEVLVGLAHCRPLSPINIARFDLLEM